MFAILVVFLVSALSQDLHEDRVRNPSVGVDFIHHSERRKISGDQFRLINFIRNDSSDPLSVEWTKGGITCVGTYMLKGCFTAEGKENGRIVENPPAINSDIKYGVKLNYSAAAKVYINPQPVAMKSPTGNEGYFEKTYEIRNAENETVLSIRVISKLKDRKTSELTFSVDGGLSIALGMEANDKPPPKEGWSFGQTKTFQELRFVNESNKQALMELFETSGNKVPDHWRVIENWKEHIDLEGVIVGSDMTLKRITILGYSPDREGFVAFTANVYVPKNVRIR